MSFGSTLHLKHERMVKRDRKHKAAPQSLCTRKDKSFDGKK